jgi:hypothetical protein
MAFTRVAAIAVAVAGAAIGLASPASAQDRLDGAYTFVNGPTTNTWSITTFCNAEITCGGTVSTSTGLVAKISRVTGGPWTVERHDVPNGWTCPDGSSGPADLMYSFDAATLVGALSSVSKPGVCGNPNPGYLVQPISLLPA